ncbi:hypothetical protein [Paenarthrobacter sp. Z7-10]|uniref:hypothetical protein n=1 Tax=Paenarthrobacter sp. Z7-10 TaxID=2787635 RepID=UPI0022A94E71|nr:hypothetical protein [Paenarthrobacter sp. Z7-10]
MEARDWAFDFRVGGRDMAEGKFHKGPVSRYEDTHTDIVEHHRVATTYDMWLGRIHTSTSLASLEFDPIDEGTRFTHVEHGVLFDQFCADSDVREKGTRGLLQAPGNYLALGTQRTCQRPLTLSETENRFNRGHEAAAHVRENHPPQWRPNLGKPLEEPCLKQSCETGSF